MGNVIGNIITLVYKAFSPIKGYNKHINRSRKINSYNSIVDLIYIGVNYGIFRLTNQYILIHTMSINAFIKLVGAFIVQTKSSYRFLYSIILIILAQFVTLILLIFLIIRLVNIFSICKLLYDYHDKYPELDNSIINRCHRQKSYFFFWMGLQLIFASSGAIEIYFDFISCLFFDNRNKTFISNITWRRTSFFIKSI